MPQDVRRRITYRKGVHRDSPHAKPVASHDVKVKAVSRAKKPLPKKTVTPKSLRDKQQARKAAKKY